MRDLSRLRRNAHLPLALVALALARPSATSCTLAAVVVFGGIAIRLWAAGFLVKGGELCTDGPYRSIRHPLYLGSFLAALGICVITNSIWGWAVILPLFVLVYAAQVIAEERDLRARYGRAHDEWASRVPLFLPRFRASASPSGQPWRWSQVLVNREHYHVLLTLLLLVLFVSKWLWWPAA
jgi:protein-S-isoprenylcysteine O-methyltransferase Ste14